jgi:multidrug efflux system membrane fusion protein
MPRSAESTNERLTDTPRVVVAIPEGQTSSESLEILTVRAARIGPQSYVEQVRVRGRTQASRHVQVRAEEPGRIVSEPIPRGSRVSQGDILCEIAVDNRQSNLQKLSADGNRLSSNTRRPWISKNVVCSQTW